MGKIFISYSREDSEFALKIVKSLETEGIETWIDQLNIKSGELWDESLEKALDLCVGIIIILSPNSVNSKNVRNEIVRSIRNKKHIFPILYKKCDTPLNLECIEYIDFSIDYSNGLKKLLISISSFKTTLNKNDTPIDNLIDKLYYEFLNIFKLLINKNIHVICFKQKKDITFAVLSSILFGSVGLSIYLKSFFDFVITFAMTFVLYDLLILNRYKSLNLIEITKTHFLINILIAIYAYYRVNYSNKKFFNDD